MNCNQKMRFDDVLECTDLLIKKLSEVEPNYKIAINICEALKCRVFLLEEALSKSIEQG